MYISSALVLGMIALNMICINGVRNKRSGLEEYCALPKPIRQLQWECIYELSSERKNIVFSEMSKCYGYNSYDEAYNYLCTLTEEEINALVISVISCLNKAIDEDFEPMVPDSDIESCVKEKLE